MTSFSVSKNFFLSTIFLFLFLSKVLSQTPEKKLIGSSKESTDLYEASKKAAVATTLLSHDTSFTSAVNKIRQAQADKHEYSITFGREHDGHLTMSPIVKGDSTNGKVRSNWPGAFADLHNHFNEQPPSAGDLYYLIKINSKNHFYNARFVIMKNGTIYALYIYEPKLANDFISKYPLEQMHGFSPRFPEPIFDDVDRISTYFEGKPLTSWLPGKERWRLFLQSTNPVQFYCDRIALEILKHCKSKKRLQTE